jgi:hypothetical protein
VFLKLAQLAQIRSCIFIALLLPLLAGCWPDQSKPISVPSDISPSVPSSTIETSPDISSAISVPQGAPVELDGSIAPTEWDDAAVDAFSDGSQLYLMHQDGNLYLAIRSVTPEMIVGNVFVENNGEIAILHASAALGTAVYEVGDGEWSRIRDFTWSCRSSSDSDSARAERQTFLEQERWLASNARMGNPNELEYQIEVPVGVWRLAVVILRASNPNTKHAWPVDLDDDCVLPTPGGIPAQLQFNPGSWVSLELENGS